VPAKNLVAVVLWMTGALLSFCAMAVSVRVLAGTLSVWPIELTAAQSLVLRSKR